MSLIDIVLLLIVVVALATGAMKGFVRQLGTIAGLIGGIIVCRIWGDDVAAWAVARGSENESLLRALVYAALFLVVFFGLALAGRLVGALLSAVKLRVIDRIGGALFRTALWLFITSLLLNIYLGVCPADNGRFHAASKPWRAVVVHFAPNVLGYLAN